MPFPRAPEVPLDNVMWLHLEFVRYLNKIMFEAVI
jgi:hypothetical protein